jgi:membrane protein DedA with SNARE-associated domain
MLASIFSVAQNIGLPLIFVIVMLETGCGIPVAPGEIALVTGGIAASDHKLSIVAVIAVAAAGAIVGDNIGYVIGRNGGRRLLEAENGPFRRKRHRAIEVADPFFEKHGSKAVFYGRWLPVLRVFASWLAGGAKMRWLSFAFWNAAGGICWAISIGLLGYYVGSGARAVLNDIGAYGAIIVVAGLVAIFLFNRWRERRMDRASTAGSPVSDDGPADVPAERISTPIEPPA